jgi:hypothetical protein
MAAGLPGEVILRIREVLLGSFPNKPAVSELLLVINRNYDQLEVPNYSFTDSFTHVLSEASREGWLPGLLRAAAQQAPNDVDIAQLVTYYTPISPGPAVDHFRRCRLSGGFYLIDRDPLRDSLVELSRLDGQRILVVTGAHQSGKSYTRRLIWHVRDMLGSFTVVDIDLERQSRLLGPDRTLAPDDIARLLTRELQYDDLRVPPPPQDQQWARWTLEFCEAFQGRALRDPELRWLVFDAFNKVVLSTAVLDLIKELALRVGEQLNRFRLVLVDFVEPLPLDVAPTVRPDRPDPIGAAELGRFLIGYLREVGSPLDEDAQKQRAAKVIKMIMEGLVTEQPNYLITLSQRVTEQLPILTAPQR